MSLQPGTTLGPYEVLSAIGAGGMGEVYKARDTKLDRDVALKILPDAFVNDPERLARFQREAKVLASLNHPNIAAIYGLEESGDSPALVLEYVPGPTLQDRIAKGPIPLDEALPIARQIAEALEAAHEQGIIHRDLKPANVKVKDDGTVKVLDFGLAKALGPDLSDLDAANSPTMTMTAAATKMGVIMGTAAYMSPEQARGKTVDKRADIWAFGVVLWEMLTGRQAFGGTDISETLASVLKTDLDLTRLPRATPGPIRKLIRRCVERDRAERLRDIGDARFEIKEALGAPSVDLAERDAVGQPALWQRPVPLAFAGLALMALTGLAVWNLTRPAELAPPRVGRFTLTAPGNEPISVSNLYQDLAVSPDGTKVVYMAGLSVPSSALTVRPVNQLAGEPLDATTPDMSFNPFVSPDNEWVGFFDNTTKTLRKVSILGGPAITLCDIGSLRLRGASWGDDDTIIFGTDTPSGLWRVPGGGGEPEELTTVDGEGGGVNHGWPEVLPGGRAVLFTILTTDLDTAQIAVADLATGAHRVLVPGGHAPRYAATGHLVYAASGTLRAVAFDLEALEIVGNPVPVLDGVVTKTSGAANFDLAEDGSLVYLPGSAAGGSAERGLMWVDGAGQEEALPPAPGPYLSVSLSPDGSRAALGMNAGENLDIWVAELERGSLTRVTTDAAPDTKPLWTPDGEFVVYESLRDGTPALYRKAADGTGPAEHLFTLDGATQIVPYDWTPNGTALLVMVETQETSRDIGLVSLEPPGSWEPLIQTEAREWYPALSPDGRWLAYASTETGRSEVYVQRFPELGQRRPISLEGGFGPAWSADGRELFYLLAPGGGGPQAMMRVAIESDATTLTAGQPERLFDRTFYDQRGQHRRYDLSPDGRFLMIAQGDAGSGTSPSDLVFVLNWHQELLERVPVP